MNRWWSGRTAASKNVVIFVRTKGVKVNPDTGEAARQGRARQQELPLRAAHSADADFADAGGEELGPLLAQQQRDRGRRPGGESVDRAGQGRDVQVRPGPDDSAARGLQHSSVDEGVGAAARQPVLRRVEGGRHVRDQGSARRQARVPGVAREGGQRRHEGLAQGALHLRHQGRRQRPGHDEARSEVVQQVVCSAERRLITTRDAVTRFVQAITLLGCAGLLLAARSGCRKAAAINPAPDLKVAKELRAGSGGGEATATAQAAQPTGTGWGALKGKFVFAGDPPAAAFLSTGGKDGAVCGQQVPNQQLVVDSGNKGIANIVVFARKVSRVFKPEEAPRRPRHPPSIFDQKGCLFLSHVFATLDEGAARDQEQRSGVAQHQL